MQFLTDADSALVEVPSFRFSSAFSLGFLTRLWLKNATFLQSFVASLIRQIRAEKPLIHRAKQQFPHESSDENRM
jgi:hypothetical protein